MLYQIYFNNTVKEYMIAAGTFAVVLAVFLIGRNLLVGRLRWLAQQTETHFDDLFVDLLEMIRNPECYILAFYAATRPLVVPTWLDRAFHAVVILAVTFRIATMIQRVVRFAIEEGVMRHHEQDTAYIHTSKTLNYVTSFIVWACAVLFALSNLGFNISSMIAGLGIGGIAVALAAQAVLGDLFAAIALYLDRPFVIGDAITFNDTTGEVEQIGFKTTRIRAVGGELLIIPNSQLASAKIQNWRHLAKRRVVQVYNAAYGTPPEKLAKLPGQIAQLIEQAGGGKTKTDRVHLKSLSSWSIDIEAVYFVLSADYGDHMDIQQRLHLAVLDLFAKEGIQIPFPTQSVVLSK